LPLPEQFQLQFAPNYRADDKRILLFPGETHEERTDKLNELIKIWIATIEKARDTKWVRKTGRNDNVSPITEMAQVRIYFTASKTSRRDANGNFEFELSSKYDHTELKKLENSESDEIVLYENGTDVRVLILRRLSAQSLVIFGQSL
jgi:hypothetical protein